MRLAFQRPFWPDNVFGHLAATAVPGVEEWRDGAYRRALRLARGPAVVALRPRPDHIACELTLTDPRDGGAAVAICRRLLDLDADPAAIDSALAADPVLAPLVARAPGRRVPGAADGDEMALRAVVGQQVSTAAARTLAARIVRAAGEEIRDPAGGLSHLFPTAAAVAELDPALLAMPQSRRRSLLGLAAALARGEIDLRPTGDRDAARARLLALSGIGPWTVETIAMRALGDPDAFVASDLGVRAALAALGLTVRDAERWRPWRAYAVQHLWALGDHAINVLPRAQ